MKRKYIIVLIIMLVVAISGYFYYDYLSQVVFDMAGKAFLRSTDLNLNDLPKVTQSPTPNNIQPPSSASTTDKPNSPTPTPQPKKPSLDYSKLKEIQKIATTADKQKVFNIVLSSLSPEDYSEIVKMSKGGLTPEENQKAMAMVTKSLSPAKKSELMNLYIKYLDQIKK